MLVCAQSLLDEGIARGKTARKSGAPSRGTGCRQSASDVPWSAVSVKAMLSVATPVNAVDTLYPETGTDTEIPETEATATSAVSTPLVVVVVVVIVSNSFNHLDDPTLRTRRWIPLYRKCVIATIRIQMVWRRRMAAIQARRRAELAASSSPMPTSAQASPIPRRNSYSSDGIPRPSTPSNMPFPAEDSEERQAAAAAAAAAEAAAAEEKRLCVHHSCALCFPLQFSPAHGVSALLHFPCFAVLSCTVLSCPVLHCTVLYCTVLYCTALYCTAVYRLLFLYVVCYPLFLCVVRPAAPPATESKLV
jgi:hypothetical protein